LLRRRGPTGLSDAPAANDQQQRAEAFRRLVSLRDCERVLVTAGGAAGTPDGDARFVRAQSIADT